MTPSAGADAGLPPARRGPRPQPGGPLARYSRFVRVMKVALPALAAVLLGLVLIWPRLTLEDKRFQVGFAKLPTTGEVETLAMRNARYYGLDESNRPYAVSSDLATQEPGNSDLIHLEAPKADFTSSSGEGVLVDGARGLYRQSAKTLDLSGGVNLFHEAGYELHTATATIDLARNSARGTDPVEGFGPQGAIRAAGFEISGRGRAIIFTGKARLTLRGAAPNDPDKGGTRR